MTLELEPITIQKLAFAKQLYLRANVLSEPNRGISDRILSVIIFDLTIETILRIIIHLLKNDKKSDYIFSELINAVNDLLVQNNLGNLPIRSKIEFIHSIRNNIQHKVTYPRDIDLSNVRAYAKDFLKKTIKQIWGKNPIQLKVLMQLL